MKKICVIVCSVLLAICFIALIAMDLPTLTRQQTINVDYNGNNIVMTLYKGEDKGVLMLGGFSSDQQSLFPLAKVFNDNGYSVLTLDYTGHGRSGGKVDFDNATNGEIPKQLELALKTFKGKTNLENQDIILFGHSMGGRAICASLLFQSVIMNATAIIGIF